MVAGLLVGAIVPTVGILAGYKLGCWFNPTQDKE